MQQGTGKKFSSDGSVYEGHWMFSQKYGKGTLTHSNGVSYTGILGR